MNSNKDMKNIIEQSFTQYSGAVLQSRAIVDVRDCLKPSARQIFYCLYTDKFLPTKPFKKTLKAIGSVARMYIHGDSSAEGIIMRSSQSFAMRYPLIEVEGNNGNLMSSGNWAASRYSASRLSNFSVKLFEDVDKDTITDWRDNYDDTEKYPSVLPSKGFYNIVNGTMGIGIGAASSIPQFNIKDINRALEILLLNPNATFEEIYCQPDFATGCYLINEEEVKNALKYGSKDLASSANVTGAACKLRAKIDYDKKENCLIVTEIPYGVYTNTICGQLEALIEDENINPGIDRFNDLTGENAFIKIYLKNKVDYNRVIKSLYKNTSLQYHYSINMTMLDQGRFPKVFTWKEALQSHINHELEVYTNGFNFELNKIRNKIHIIDGLLICMASIEEVIQTIKTSSSTQDASIKLQKQFLLDVNQAKAVLDMKLSRLAHLEVEKLKNEKVELEKEQNRILNILNNKDLLNQELINEWRLIANKYGDEHRTKIIKIIENEDDEIDNIPPQDCVVVLSENGNIKRIPKDTFKVQRRNGKGIKNEDDIILDSITTNTTDNLILFTDKGLMYKILVDNIPEGTNSSKGQSIHSLTQLKIGEKVIAITSINRKTDKKYVVFITKQGIIKKTSIDEYKNVKKSSGIIAIKLKDNDTIANVLLMNEEDLILITKKGMGIHFETTDINAIGRATAGIKSIKLNIDDEVLCGLPLQKDSKYISLFSSCGYGKKIDINDLFVQGRVGKGLNVYKTDNHTGDIVGCSLINDNDNIVIMGKTNTICISATDIPLLSRQSIGNIMIKNSSIQKIVKL